MATIEQRAHANLVGFTRVQARLHGAEVLDEPGVFAFRGEVDFPAARLAIRTGSIIEPTEAADAICDFLLGSGTTAAVFVQDTDTGLHAELTRRGFIDFSQAPEMVCDARLEARPEPDGIRVRLAESDADVAAYAEIAGHAFRHLSIPEAITRDTIDHPAVMLDPRVVIALAELDGHPVAGASAYLVDESGLVAGGDGYVGWVACHDDARGRGLGDLVTRRATNEAFDRGASIVTLEASRFGESTYARMGYREVYRYSTLIHL
jgi:ribosomal protein S18 acetylase RimI-like enzyme